MVRDCQVDGLMNDKVMQYKIRSHDEPPVEREIAECRAIPPFCALAHHIDTVRLPLEPLCDGRKEARDLSPSLLAKPVFKRSHQGGSIVRTTQNCHLPLVEAHSARAMPSFGAHHPHWNVFAPEENLAAGPLHWPSNRLTPARTRKLRCGPLFVFLKESKALLGLTPLGYNDLKAPECDLEPDLLRHRRAG